MQLESSDFIWQNFVLKSTYIHLLVKAAFYLHENYRYWQLSWTKNNKLCWHFCSVRPGKCSLTPEQRFRIGEIYLKRNKQTNKSVRADDHFYTNFAVLDSGISTRQRMCVLRSESCCCISKWCRMQCMRFNLYSTVVWLCPSTTW